MEKKKRLFSVFDVAVVLFVILAALVWVLILGRTPEVETTFAGSQARYFLEVQNLTALQAAEPQEGDLLQEGTRHLPIGQIVSVEISPHELRVDDHEAQTIQWEDAPNRYTIVITVETEVVETDGDILAKGEVAIKGGGLIHITGPGYAFANVVVLGLERGAIS